MYVSSLCLFVDLFQSLSQSFCLSLKPMYTHIHMFKCESTLNEEEKSSVRPCVRPYGQAVSLRWWPSDVFLFFIFYQIFLIELPKLKCAHIKVYLRRKDKNKNCVRDFYFLCNLLFNWFLGIEEVIALCVKTCDSGCKTWWALVFSKVCENNCLI